MPFDTQTLVDYCHGLYDAWNRGDMETFYAGIHEHVTDHNAGEEETGIEGVRNALDTVRQAFPDHVYEVLDVVANPETMSLVCRLKCTATHVGDLFGLAPSGKKAEWVEARFVRLVPSEDPEQRFPVQTMEHWCITESLPMMVQLGHVSPPGTRQSW